MYHQKIIHSDIVVNDEGYTVNSSQQTVQQIEVIQEVILPEVSKLNESMTQESEIQYSFPHKKNSWKKNKKTDLSKSKITVFVVVAKQYHTDWWIML